MRYRFADPLELPRISPAALLQGTEGVLMEEGESWRGFTRPPPEFHDDPDGAHLFGGFAAQAIASAPAFLVSLPHSRLAGQRMSLTADGRFMPDQTVAPAYVDQYLAHLPAEETGLVPDDATGGYRLDEGNRPTRSLAGSTIVLSSAEPYNFGSFLFRVLPKLHAVRRFDMGRLPLLVYAPAPTQIAFLALLGVHPGALVLQDPGRIYALEHAIRPSLRNNQAFLDDESRIVFGELRTRFGTVPADRIYVSRLGHAARGGSTRVMLNEAALVARLQSLGFLIVEPERLSAREQIAVFSAARLVVGPSGAGMFNVVFCHPGTVVIDIESEPGWIHAHTCLFGSCALRYVIFEGRVDATDTRPIHRRWSVNIEALCDRIAAMSL